jgi:hypothetical protein
MEDKGNGDVKEYDEKKRYVGVEIGEMRYPSYPQYVP